MAKHGTAGLPLAGVGLLGLLLALLGCRALVGVMATEECTLLATEALAHHRVRSGADPRVRSGWSRSTERATHRRWALLQSVAPKLGCKLGWRSDH